MQTWLVFVGKDCHCRYVWAVNLDVWWNIYVYGQKLQNYKIIKIIRFVKFIRFTKFIRFAKL